VLTGIPVKSGDAEAKSFPDSDNIAVRQIFEHSSVLKEHFRLNAGLEYSFAIGSRLSLTPLAAFAYQTRRLEAVDGRAVVAGNKDYANFTGHSFSITEVTMYPSIGLEGTYTINSMFDIRLAGAFYPYVSTEIEVRTNFPYIENSFFNLTGLGGSAELSGIFHPRNSNYFSLIVGFSYDGMYLKQGDVSVRVEGYETPETATVDGLESTFDSTLFKVKLGFIVTL
jgi:hypothetical protein